MFKYVSIVAKELPLLISKSFILYRNYFQRKKISSEKRYQDLRSIVQKFNKKLGVEIILTGLKNLPCNQSMVLTPNHQSFMDAVCMIDFLKQKSCFVVKQEARKFFLVGKAISSIDCVFLERDNLRQEINIMKQIRNSLKDDNLKWVIFPEGTRSKNENYSLNEFKAGSYKMAMSSGVDIYPVAMWGSFRILDPKEIRFKKYPVYIHVFDPMNKKDYEKMSTQELALKIQKMIEEKVFELQELDKNNFPLYMKKKYL